MVAERVSQRAESKPDTDAPFAAVRVVELARGMAGPLAGMILADFGADVVKVEPPQGDYARSWPGFMMWNRGKRSVALDLSTTDARVLLATLVSGADVLIEDVGDTTLANWGITPPLVHCHIDGAGPAAPDGCGEVRAPHEGIVTAASGLYLGIDELFGAAPDTPRDRPIFTVAPVGSFAAAQLAVQAVVAGLLSGGKATLSTSILQGLLTALMRRPFGRVAADGTAPPSRSRPEVVRRGIGLTFATVQCADGRWLQMCARQDDQFRRWLKVVGLDEAATDPRFAQAPMGFRSTGDIDELEAAIRTRMRDKSAEEWLALLRAADVGVDPFLLPGELLRTEQFRANDGVVDVDGDSQLGAIGRLSLTPGRVRSSAPALSGNSVSWAAPGLSRTPRRLRNGGRLPLEGVTVLELAYFLAAPLATTLLAELGARVIKIEPVTGDPWRRTGTEVAHILHGKESLAIDLKSDEGRAILHRLIKRADVLVQSFRLGVAERLGFGYDVCAELNPRLVYLHSTGYGRRGPLAGRPAFHSTPNAWSGGGFLQAGRGNPPVDCSYPDPCSAIANATAIVIALYAREALDAGQFIETDMLTAGAYVVSNWTEPATQDAEQRGLDPMYRLYPCADGWLFVGGICEAHRACLKQTVGDDPDATFRTYDADHWVHVLNQAGLPAARADAATLESYLEVKNLLTPALHPQFGAYWKLPAKITIEGVHRAIGDAPLVGEHTRRILSEFGYSSGSIDELETAGSANTGRTDV